MDGFIKIFKFWGWLNVVFKAVLIISILIATVSVAVGGGRFLIEWEPGVKYGEVR
ncbi:hypothetical protein [Agarilytica rhodophyticola]|uniref:hypothetical protein n=1 Tax=Agarilytica rhodophyticola TaxID=1737490 RepID=UPI00131577CF|nr:hypothetical protein [Agarilytica rhodophyticola]